MKKYRVDVSAKPHSNSYTLEATQIPSDDEILWFVVEKYGLCVDIIEKVELTTEDECRVVYKKKGDNTLTQIKKSCYDALRACCIVKCTEKGE